MEHIADESLNSSKRVCVPDGTTPHKPREKKVKRTPSQRPVRKHLFGDSKIPKTPSFTARKGTLPQKSPVKHHKWSPEEDKALIEFIGVARTDPSYEFDFETSPTPWPAFRSSHKFWSDAALHIKTDTRSNFLLSCSRVRSRVTRTLKGKFKTIEEAEEDLDLTLDSMIINGNRMPKTVSNIQLPKTKSAHQATQTVEMSVKDQQPVQNYEPCTPTQLNTLFLKLAIDVGITTNPSNFVSLALKAMNILEQNGKSNLLYKFAYCLATTSPGTDKPLLDITRMPFGLVEYQIEFFSCTNIMQIQVPPDYQMWHETMCAEFPNRFNRLFRGPMWSGVDKGLSKDPIHAKVNVAAPSTRILQKKAAASQFSIEPILQIEALKQMKQSNPKGRFWIKADAFDVKAALQESVKGVWNGDVDLGDGKLQQLNKEYDIRRSHFDSKKLGNDKQKLEDHIRRQVDFLQLDIKFLANGLIHAEEEYSRKFNSPTTSAELLKTLCWERVEFNTLLQQGQSFKEKFDGMVSLLHPMSPGAPGARDVKNQYLSLFPDMHKYLRNLFVKKRQPGATHVLLFLISDERRNKKPFAMPVQYVPYQSIKDQFLRDMTDNIKREMVKMDLKPIGAVSDGEFNSLRTQGATRPVHLWQLIHDMKESVRRQSKATLLKMLLKIGERQNGTPIVEIADAAIPFDVIEKLHCLQVDDGLPLEDAITYLRGQLVPPGYTPFPFKPSTATESLLDKLRSLVATYRLRSRIEELKNEGVDFSMYLYVPELDPITGDIFHEREDHCHVLKRIWKHTREKGPEGMNLGGFDEAVQDPSTGLTLAALRGERKQSVQDAERMLSYLVAQFLREKGYEKEAKYVEIVAGWHEAADGRGLSQLQRCKKNYNMLNLIIDEWMPWHKTCYDFSKIDINRPVQGICGFSRETVIAVTTNIESMEFRRRQNSSLGFEEHPRAGSTDDVEAMIGLLHRTLGNTFTLKQFKYAWRNIVREFCKRMAPDLPFYFWTLNERYREDDYQSFDDGPDTPADQDAATHPLRLHRLRLNRREDSSIVVAGRAFLPARNQTSIRQRIHRPVAALPNPARGF